jgi:hypothetical protein
VSEGFWNYLNDVERFFALVRASGFVLSPTDCEKVRVWYMKGVPLRVVLGGVTRGLKSFRYHAAKGQRAPFRLNYYSKFIAAQVRNFRGTPPGSAGATPPPSPAEPGTPPVGGRGSGAHDKADLPRRRAIELVEHLHAEAELQVEAEERQREREVKEKLLAGLCQVRADLDASRLATEDVEHALLLLDADILDFYHSRLDDREREEIDRRVAGKAASSGLGNKAREGMGRVERARLLREQLGVLVLAE